MSSPKKHSKAPVIAVAVLAALGIATGAYYYLRGGSGPPEFQGWVESYLIFVSPDETGRVETVSVREGDTVAVGSPLFTLDADLQKAAVAENEAAVTNARITFQRAKELLAKSVGSQKVFDDAESALRSAEARLNSARTRLDRRRMVSPVAGSIQELYFRVGEMVAAGRPLVSVQPPGNVRVRFFVPQALLPTIHIGDPIVVACDGCPPGQVARVNFISVQAEFTPPVIYSQEERARLVFRVEAIPERPEDLRVGQPVSVALQRKANVSHAQR
jgi:HlyD family secretion protein